MFILGSTGTGKTAILRMLAKQQANTATLELSEMAMGYIASNDVVQFMTSLDIDLSLFFHTLWKQVICIEFIKMLGLADDRGSFQNKIQKLLNTVQFKTREKLQNFIDRNENKFWNTVDENVVELVDNLARDVSAELGGEVKSFTAKAGYTRSLCRERKTQLQQRAKRFINPQLVSELSQVIDALNRYTENKSSQYYLLIDKLDENWIEDSLKYRLIHSLFDALKSLRSLRQSKVVVALRHDIYEKMILEAPSSTIQIEKYDDLMVRLKWSKDQLKSLAEKRINYLFRRKYSSNNVHFDDIFREVDGRTSTFSYLVDRTLFRPRDVINFINFALHEAEGKTAVSKTDFLRAERAYSDHRLMALKHEWSPTFPGVGALLDLLKNKPEYFGVDDFCDDAFVNQLFDRVGSTAESQGDSLWLDLESYVQGRRELHPIDFARTFFSRLHLIGAVGLKVNSTAPWQWIYNSGRPVPAHAIDPESKVKIHPMLTVALHNVNRAKREHD